MSKLNIIAETITEMRNADKLLQETLLDTPPPL